MGPESKKFPVGLSDTLGPRSRTWLFAKGDSGPEKRQPEPWAPVLGLRGIAEGPHRTRTVWHLLQTLMYWKVSVMLFFRSPLPCTSVNYHEEFFKNIIEDKERCY